MPAKPVPLPETPIKIPAWSAEGKETHITATKRCLVTERAAGRSSVQALEGQIGLNEIQLRVLEGYEKSEGLDYTKQKAGARARIASLEEQIKRTKVNYTTDDCPVYEIEKCAVPEADPGLQAANVEVCAVVKVDESMIGKTVSFPGTSVGPVIPISPIIANRIIVRPTGCSVVKGEGAGAEVFTTMPERRLVTPAGEHAPEGAVECVHTVLYEGTMEGIADVPDEQLALRTPVKPVQLAPLEHFTALWSYLDGILKEGIANVFQAAAGPGEAPVGFNTEMQKQVYTAIARVAPTWATHNLLPPILEAWKAAIEETWASRERARKRKSGLPEERFLQDKFEVLNEAFGLYEAAKQSPAIAGMLEEMFPKYKEYSATNRYKNWGRL